MNFQTCLNDAVERLARAGIGTARLDALVLFEDITGKDRAWLLARPEHKISDTEASKLKKLLSLRAEHLPLAYVRGKTEFYGREFVITPDVLEPRPESETMVDMLKSLANLGTRPYIADVGTGSGALGITAKLEVPKAKVDLIDLDDKALKIAKINVDKFTLTLQVIQSDLLFTTAADYDILLCNLPYVPDDFKVNTAAAHEPKLAIYGGKDGLDVYRKLFQQLKNRPLRPLYILSEAFPKQQAGLGELAAAAGYKEADKNDFIQLFTRIQ